MRSRASRGGKASGGPAIRDASAAREAALTALERRRRTRREVETVLTRKGFAPGVFAPVLDRLAEVGLIDDLEYARVYIRRRAASKPRGARLLRGELLARGVPGALIDEALAEARREGDPVDDALRALAGWRPRGGIADRGEWRRKIWQFLARRGFSGGVIEEAVRRMDVGTPDEEE